MRQSEPKWLTLEQVLAIHDELIRRHGGSSGTRDKNLAQSAIDRPKNVYSYGERDLLALAAVYLSGITKNHPFVDGNKRTASVVALTFLTKNGLSLDVPQAELVIAVRSHSAGKMSLDDLTRWMRDRAPNQTLELAGQGRRK
jgi:death-on-curing protein